MIVLYKYSLNGSKIESGKFASVHTCSGRKFFLEEEVIYTATETIPGGME